MDEIVTSLEAKAPEQNANAGRGHKLEAHAKGPLLTDLVAIRLRTISEHTPCRNQE